MTVTEEAARGLLRWGNLPHLWCPGCSHGIVLRAVARAILMAGLERDRTAVVSGIGCAARASGYLDLDGVHTTHGRPLAFATGIKLANPDLNVIVLAGDGDTAAIGGNHFLHAARRNIGLTLVCMNNNIYGMTGGQHSPTTHPGDRATTAPYGHLEPAFDLCRVAEAAGATYVARGTAYHFQPLVRYLATAFRHRGFAFVEVVSICPVYYGRQNGMSTAPEMLRWIAERCVGVKEAERLPPEERAGRIVVGEFRRAQAPEFSSAYRDLVVRVMREGALRRGDGEQPGAGAAAGGPPGEGRAAAPPARVEVRLAGAGGQGQVLAAVLLAEAAMSEGYQVVQSQDYGPESRGGASKAEVILARGEEIDYPKVVCPDVLLAMSQAAADRYGAAVRPGGVIVADSTWVTAPPAPPGVRVYALPLTRLARERVGRALVANAVALGAVAALTGVVGRPALEAAVARRAPRGTAEVNLRALAVGYEAGAAARKGEQGT